jgi:hypothetical protein
MFSLLLSAFFIEGFDGRADLHLSSQSDRIYNSDSQWKNRKSCKNNQQLLVEQIGAFQCKKNKKKLENTRVMILNGFFLLGFG